MTGLLSSLLQLGPSINKGGCHSSERRIKSLCKQDSGVLLLPPLPAKAILLLHQIATARSIFYLENVPSTEGPKSFTYYFGYFLFIPWQMHTCIQCIIIVSTLIPSPYPPTLPHIFMSSYIFIGYWNQFVLPVCTWVWGHPPEYGQSSSSHTPEEK